jgi:D-glycero-D-manno-heptose 1,7-bisphosphate phosphatase
MIRNAVAVRWQRKIRLMRIPGYPLNSEGVWCEVFAGPRPGRPALFLDRDGAVIEDTEYLCRVQDIVMIAGAGAVIAAANQRDVAAVLVTNQAGIGRGYYGWAEFERVQQAIVLALARDGAQLDAVYACAHHPQGRGAFAHPNHPARKPNPGMLLQAASDLAIDLKTSWLVGDKPIDVEAAKRAGLAGAMQVATGHGTAERQRAGELATASFEVRLDRSVADAMTLPLLMDAKITT